MSWVTFSCIPRRSQSITDIFLTGRRWAVSEIRGKLGKKHTSKTQRPSDTCQRLPQVNKMLTHTQTSTSHSSRLQFSGKVKRRASAMQHTIQLAKSQIMISGESWNAPERRSVAAMTQKNCVQLYFRLWSRAKQPFTQCVKPTALHATHLSLGASEI